MSKTEEVTEGSISVTVKHGKSFEDTWTVFRGSVNQIREDIGDYFGIEPEYASRLSLHELVINVTNLAHGTSSMANILGAISVDKIPEPSGGPSGGAAWDQADKGKPATPAPPVDPNVLLIAQLGEASTIEALKRLWADNQAAFSNDAVKAAYSTKGKALKAAA